MYTQSLEDILWLLKHETSTSILRGSATALKQYVNDDFQSLTYNYFSELMFYSEFIIFWNI